MISPQKTCLFVIPQRTESNSAVFPTAQRENVVRYSKVAYFRFPDLIYYHVLARQMTRFQCALARVASFPTMLWMPPLQLWFLLDVHSMVSPRVCPNKTKMVVKQLIEQFHWWFALPSKDNHLCFPKFAVPNFWLSNLLVGCGKPARAKIDENFWEAYEYYVHFPPPPTDNPGFIPYYRLVYSIENCCHFIIINQLILNLLCKPLHEQ